MISLRQTIAVIAAACFALAGCPCGLLSSVSASDVPGSPGIHASHAGQSVHQASTAHASSSDRSGHTGSFGSTGSSGRAGHMGHAAQHVSQVAGQYAYADFSVDTGHDKDSNHQAQAGVAVQHAAQPPLSTECCQHFDDVAVVVSENSRSSADTSLARGHQGDYALAGDWLLDGPTGRAGKAIGASQAKAVHRSSVGLSDGQGSGDTHKAAVDTPVEDDTLSLSVYDSASYIVGWFARTLLQEASTPVNKADKLLN